MESCELITVSIELKEMDGYTSETMLLQTEPDVWMPFTVLKPFNVLPQAPCIIATHGHHGGGRLAVCGRRDIPAVHDSLEIYHYDYGVSFVKAGYVVFAPDARGFGERREWTKQGDSESDFLSSSCDQLNKMAISLGRSLTGMWVWDLMRLIDYIETRDDCDKQRIAVAGLSGGGLQALWLTAMEERIRCAIVSGYFYGYKDSLLKLSDNCACNYVPDLWKWIDMGDLGAMIAPRPLLIESGDQDPLNGENGLSNVFSQIIIAQGAYTLIGAPDHLQHSVCHGGHQWYGRASETFLHRFL